MAQEMKFNIEGMTCDHCVNAVTTAIQETPGVTSATVSLDEKLATVTGDAIDVEAIVAAVAEEGYEAAVRA